LTSNIFTGFNNLSLFIAVDPISGFKRIIPRVKGNATMQGCIKANSSNLPSVDLWVFAEYLSKTHWSPELKNFKANRCLIVNLHFRNHVLLIDVNIKGYDTVPKIVCRLWTNFSI
jgi:hypothetical protein